MSGPASSTMAPCSRPSPDRGRGQATPLRAAFGGGLRPVHALVLDTRVDRPCARRFWEGRPGRRNAVQPNKETVRSLPLRERENI